MVERQHLTSIPFSSSRTGGLSEQCAFLHSTHSIYHHIDSILFGDILYNVQYIVQYIKKLVVCNVHPMHSLVVQVFETMGRVEKPFYSVRFNSGEHVAERGVAVGTRVLFAPFAIHEPHRFTRFVFLKQLLECAAVRSVICACACACARV